MSKDPAVLFYTSDFISGTITMTDEQRGKYILLLCIQHQKGYLTEKDMLNICKTYDIDIWEKFIKEGDLLYNVRMREESEKRTKYADSRRNNRLKKEVLETDMNNICLSYVEHMENENINEDIIINKGAIKFKIPTISEITDYCKERNNKVDANKFFDFYESKGWMVGKNKMKDWKACIRTWEKSDIEPITETVRKPKIMI